MSLGIGFIWIENDWFGINNYISWGGMLMVLYFVITIFGSIYFTYLEKDNINIEMTL